MEVEETLDKDLCIVTPKWNKIIHKVDNIEQLITVRGIDGIIADLSAASCCFVGEAWNWSGDYMSLLRGNGCAICRDYSNIFLDAAAPISMKRTFLFTGKKSSKSFLSHARDFIAHFKRDHQDRYINKVNENKELCGQERSL